MDWGCQQGEQFGVSHYTRTRPVQEPATYAGNVLAEVVTSACRSIIGRLGRLDKTGPTIPSRCEWPPTLHALCWTEQAQDPSRGFRVETLMSTVGWILVAGLGRWTPEAPERRPVPHCQYCAVVYRRRTALGEGRLERARVHYVLQKKLWTLRLENA